MANQFYADVTTVVVHVDLKKRMSEAIETDQPPGMYSHLFNKRGAWNKRGGGAKVAKSLNVELGINEEGGIFGKN